MPSAWAPSLFRQALGGRRTSAARLVSQLRPLFRRDVSLAVDLVVAPLSVMNAALAVGDVRQQADLAGRISVGASGSARCWPTPTRSRRRAAFVCARIDDGWLADGESPLVASADAALGRCRRGWPVRARRSCCATPQTWV